MNVSTRYDETLELRASEWDDVSSYSFHTCRDCGSLVRDTDRHDDWHRRIEKPCA